MKGGGKRDAHGAASTPPRTMEPQSPVLKEKQGTTAKSCQVSSVEECVDWIRG